MVYTLASFINITLLSMNVDPIRPYMERIRICIAESQPNAPRSIVAETVWICISLKETANDRQKKKKINVIQGEKKVMRKTLKNLRDFTLQWIVRKLKGWPYGDKAALAIIYEYFRQFASNQIKVFNLFLGICLPLSWNKKYDFYRESASCILLFFYLLLLYFVSVFFCFFNWIEWYHHHHQQQQPNELTSVIFFLILSSLNQTKNSV